MSAPSSPHAIPLQQSWDTAATLAVRGEQLPVIVAKVLDAAGPGIEVEAERAVPARGRTFWASMARSFAVGLVADAALLVIGSLGAHPVPVLKELLVVGILVWAVGFGVVAANHKVRQRRIQVGLDRRAMVERIAQEAARHAWASQIPGKWQPLGPAVKGVVATDDVVPTAWLRRFGVAPGEAVGMLVDGTASALTRAIREGRGRPVVLFVPEPGFFTDDARTQADVLGVALFAVGRDGLHSMSHAASAALKAYADPVGTDGPVRQLLSEWSVGQSARSNLL